MLSALEDENCMLSKEASCDKSDNDSLLADVSSDEDGDWLLLLLDRSTVLVEEATCVCVCELRVTVSWSWDITPPVNELEAATWEAHRCASKTTPRMFMPF
jgi:hypothetical protein